LRPEAWLDWEVVLKDGTTFRVRAINEWHAGSEVVYGHGLGKIDGRTGEPIGEVVVHRDNIATVRLLHPGTDIVADAT
jgi:hypothetical protein